MASSLTESAANFRMPAANFSVAIASSLSNHLNAFSSKCSFSMSTLAAEMKQNILAYCTNEMGNTGG